MALNYYRLLGIPPDADQQRIKSVYRSLAKRFHPDANRGSEAAADLFRQVNQAYKVLSDPAARSRYDQKLGIEEARREQEKPGSRAKARLDPQQKFNKFLNTLLDVLVGPEGPPPGSAVQPQAPVRKPQPNKPAFNTVYKQAMAKDTATYKRGRDGVYRKQRSQGPTPVKKKPAV